MSAPKTISREQFEAIYADAWRCLSAIFLRQRGKRIDEQLRQTMLGEVDTAQRQILAAIDRLAE